MYVLLCALAFAAGVVLVVQVGVNATLRTGLGSPVAAALASFLVGSAALALLLLANGAWPARSQLLAAPAWAWAGGVLGAFYVVSTIVARAAPRRRGAAVARHPWPAAHLAAWSITSAGSAFPSIP